MPKATNDVDRGTCARKIKHSGPCGNRTCCDCGAKLLKGDCAPDVFKRGRGLCRRCYNKRVRKRRGKPKNYQNSGDFHIFLCGCSGTLPEKGKSNMLAVQSKSSHKCRINSILSRNQSTAKRRGYRPMNKNTPHTVIRIMMEQPCFYCGYSLDWSQLMSGKTPHLDHDHETGKINGFTHPTCNLRGLKNTIDKLRKEILKFHLTNLLNCETI